MVAKRLHYVIIVRWIAYMKSELQSELKLFKKMYYCLFNAITDCEKYETKEEMTEFLKAKQIETEEIYISFGENID